MKKNGDRIKKNEGKAGKAGGAWLLAVLPFGAECLVGRERMEKV